MKNLLYALWKKDEGQDLIEYTLLIAFIMIASAALMIANGGGIQGILFVTTNNLNAANEAANGQ
jgi:Flp pilus assembly pilin Flp